MNPSPLHSTCRRWLLVVLYAIAMAWVESAVVFYLRSMIHRIEPYQPDPFPIVGGFGWVELIREFSTIVMLFAVGVLAGRTWRARLGYFAVAFGIWDIFYYVFLKAMCGWPHSLLDWDILFLLPVPWWGPVLAPVLISLLMIFWGTVATQFENPPAPVCILNVHPTWPLQDAGTLSPSPRLAGAEGPNGERAGVRCLFQAVSGELFRCTPAPALSNPRVWLLNFAGVVLALYVFMADTLAAVPRGLQAVCNVLPEKFNWPLFLVAWLLMAAPVIQTGWRFFTPLLTKSKAGNSMPVRIEQPN